MGKLLIATLILCSANVFLVDNAAAEKSLRLENRDHIRLSETRGFLNLNGTFTLETWVRWDDDHSGVISLISDDLSPGELQNVAVREICGWGLRLSPVQGGRFRDLELYFAATLPRRNTPQWNSLKFRIPIVPSGVPEPWHHIAICKTPQVVVLFLDGNPIINAQCGGTRFALAPTDLYLGVRHGARSTRQVFADFRAFRIVDRITYKKPFKPQPVLPKQGRTVLELDFGQNSAGVVPDVTTGKHSGVVSGGTWIDE